jgi:CheY-like chemotaxis protein
MDEASQNLIFDPDFTTNGLEAGATLELSTVYGIVKQGGGQILVYSEPGRGTTFNVYWPQVGPPVVSAKHVDRRDSLQSPKTILVVEDEVLLLEVTCEFLQETGYTVLSARSSEGALELARPHDGAIDLLLTDVVMPRMNGRELSVRLLSDRPQMKVLFVSGYSDDVVGGEEQGTATESFGFLQKPFSRPTLKEKIRDMIASESINSALSN